MTISSLPRGTPEDKTHPATSVGRILESLYCILVYFIWPVLVRLRHSAPALLSWLVIATATRRFTHCPTRSLSQDANHYTLFADLALEIVFIPIPLPNACSSSSIDHPSYNKALPHRSEFFSRFLCCVARLLVCPCCCVSVSHWPGLCVRKYALV